MKTLKFLATAVVGVLAAMATMVAAATAPPTFGAVKIDQQLEQHVLAPPGIAVAPGHCCDDPTASGLSAAVNGDLWASTTGATRTDYDDNFDKTAFGTAFGKAAGDRGSGHVSDMDNYFFYSRMGAPIAAIARHTDTRHIASP